MAKRREAMLTGSIPSALLKLAAPTVVVLVTQSFVGVAETYFVSFLGTNALAGVALVFPLLVLMQTMANGGVGGGVASAVARAQGAGRKADADTLLLHALVIAVGFGLLFTVAGFLAAPAVFRALGGSGDALSVALSYSHWIFGGAVLVWTVALLAAALRGSGNVVISAAVTLGGTLLLLPLSPALIFGFGPIPRLGVAGAGMAVVIYYFCAAAVLIGYLLRRRSPLRLSFDVRRLEWRLLADVMRVGSLSMLGTIQANLTVVLVTGVVGRFGTNAIAGYGIASRLDFLMIPLVFGLGSSVLTLVGTNIGAQQAARAERIAWVGAALAVAVTETIGIAAAIFPHGWLGLFTAAPDVLATGSLYLRLVAPFYGFFGLAMVLNFAGQGAGRVLWPLLAGLMRFGIATLGGWLVVAGLGGGLRALFGLVALATFAYGGVMAVALLAKGWGRPRLPRPERPCQASGYA
jgi:putative MATE family efflux protein